jgi:hypothetical protein
MPVKSKSKSREVTVGTSGAAIPSYVREIFGDPPVLSTENRDAYDSLLARLAIEIEPREIMEWLWVRDLPDLTWQILRLRRVITSVLNISFKPALIQILDAILPRTELPPLWRSQATELAEAWYSNSKERNRVTSILAKYGLKPESVEGQAFVRRCNELEKMERMLTSAENRRNAIMRELQVYRDSSVSKKVRNEIIDAEGPKLPQVSGANIDPSR